jgi:hypothetical protein
MEITVKLKNNYGQETIYPVCEKAKMFARLAGTKTLTDTALALISALGYTVTVEQQQLPETLTFGLGK